MQIPAGLTQPPPLHEDKVSSMHKCDLWGSTSQDPTGVEIMMVSKCRRRFLTWQRRSALGLSPPQRLQLLLPFLGFATSDLWILKFSRISLLHVLVSMFRVLQCSWQNCGPSLSFCFAIYRFPSKELCISTVCDSLREKPYRIILHHFSINQCFDPRIISENKPNSQISGMMFSQTFSLPSATTQKLSTETL